MNAKSRFCQRGTSPVSGVVAGAMMLLPLGATAQAATFVVNSTGDGADINPGDGICADGAGNCTLRAAIQEANATSGTDLIDFNIPGMGPHTIQPLFALPTITDPVVIDGYTQPGASPNTNPPGLGTNAVLKIELDGSNAERIFPGPFPSGLLIEASNSAVRGLVINRFSSNAVRIRSFGLAGSGDGNTGNLVQGNFIGTDVTGTTALGNFRGVSIGNSPNTTIGGTTPGARNLISGNIETAVTISETTGAIPATGNLVQGNLIGTDVTGTTALGNGGTGVLIIGASDNTIGGMTPGARNIISDNKRDGILIRTGATGNLVQGNFIGTDVTGTTALGNGGPSRFVGVRVSAPNTTIGGTTPGAGNLISANKNDGVLLSTTGTLVQGNFIGTDVTGTAALGNRTVGVFVGPFGGNTIGGTTPGAGNLISGNMGDGVDIFVRFEGNLVQGNLIGTDVTGTTALGNGGFGLRIRNGSGNTIGGTASGAGNTIAFNEIAGVVVDIAGAAEAIGNAILSNSIFSNSGLGIDLFGVSFPVTLNDVGDGDTGANELQNFPVLTFAGSTASSTEVDGTLNSTPNTTFMLEFFSNSGCDPSGFGEGETFLGSAPVTTDGMGNVSFSVILPSSAPAGDVITATATDPNGNTSEFSECSSEVVTLDSDGDGIPDDEDACPSSDLSATIVINGVDTGVENELLPDGCTLSDLIAEVLAEDPSTADIVQTLIDLKAAGLLTGQELGALLRGANSP